MRSFLRRLLIAAAFAALTAAAPASAGAPSLGSAAMPAKLATVTKTLSAGSAVPRTCPARDRAAGTRGVDRVTYTAPISGYVTVKLRGPSTSDWDLTIFDRASRLPMQGSTSFGSNEVAQAWVDAGQKLDLQGCRRSGRASSVRMTIDLVAVAKPTGPGLAQSYVDIALTNPRADIKTLQALGIDLGENVRADRVDAVVTQPDLALLARNGFQIAKLRVADLAAKDRADRAAEARYSAHATRSADDAQAVPSGRTSYRMYEDYGTEMKALVAKYPNIMRGFKMPEASFQGREVDGVEVTDNVSAPDDGRPVFLFVAMHHAREWPAAESAMEFLYYLGQRFGNDDRVTNVLKHSRIFVVPLINPDGFIDSRTAPEELEGVPFYSTVGLVNLLAYRRKNCDGAIPSGLIPCVLQYGIDPNRNYGQYWGGPGSSTFQLDQDYHGTGPWSEPETKSVHEFSQEHGNIVTLLTMHNVAALVLRPPGLHTQGKAPDETEMKRLGDLMGKATGYTSQYGFELYDTTGTTEDWNYAAAGTFGYTIEIGPSGGDFHIAYPDGVIDQWTGGTTGKTKGKGLREAFMLIADETTKDSAHSIISGRSQPGRTLRITKKFQTETSPECLVNNIADSNCEMPGTLRPAELIDDHLTATMTVPADGHFRFHVNPSTRPFSKSPEAWTLTCEDAASKQIYETQQLTIARGQEVKLELPCGGVLPPEPVAAPVVKKKHLTKAQKCKKAKTKKAKRKYCKSKKRKHR
jgi:hypothetical protein